MTQELRERILAASYTDVLANEPVRRMLQEVVDAFNATQKCPANYEARVDAAIETHFGLKVSDFDEPLLRRARAEVERAVRRMLNR